MLRRTTAILRQYVGNNPVNWVDPWGLSASEKREGRSLTDREIELHKAAEGTPLDYEKITVIERKPTVQELKTIVETYRVIEYKKNK